MDLADGFGELESGTSKWEMGAWMLREKLLSTAQPPVNCHFRLHFLHKFEHSLSHIARNQLPAIFPQILVD